MKSAAENLVDYLNQRVSGHTFNYRHHGDIGIDAADYSDDVAFTEACAEELEIQNELTYDEIIISCHSKLLWGYGYGGWHQTNQNTRCYSCTLYAGSGAVDWEVEGFTWHEAGHHNAGHDDATYAKYVGASTWAHKITPMAMSYLFDPDGEPDTAYANKRDSHPDPFCTNLPNDTYYFKSRYKEDNHEIDRYSSCTLDLIESRWE
nr:hypothetical protein [Haloferax larsenii]